MSTLSLSQYAFHHFVVTDNLISIAPHSRTRESIKPLIKIYHQSSPSSPIRHLLTTDLFR